MNPTEPKAITIHIKINGEKYAILTRVKWIKLEGQDSYPEIEPTALMRTLVACSDYRNDCEGFLDTCAFSLYHNMLDSSHSPSDITDETGEVIGSYYFTTP